MSIRHSLILILAGLIATPLHAGASELEVPLVNYYNYAPFSMPDEKTDLTRELAELLTKNSGGRYRFVPTLLPKGRLDKMLVHEHWQGLVAWLNPRFVNDEAKSRYLWTETLMLESDLVVSHVDAPVDFQGVQSLQGKVLGTVLNQRYADIEEMIANKQLRRSDAPSQESNVRKLLLKRVDVVFISRSTLAGLQQRIPAFETKLHVAPLPRNSFTRHIMLTPELPPKLISYVQSTVAKFGGNPSWRHIAAQYHIEGQKAH
ncbi:transporter substrate-binding domain-containing protein [Oxalobacteraceae bacterium]|nr:transporter substrate-binding domain-containing protein [Oxalobacteraceae bacterium]